MSEVKKATATKAKEADEVQIDEVPTDPWDIEKTIRLPRALSGEQNFIAVSINDRDFQVPRGKEVDVPLPVYEVLERMLKAEELESNYRGEADTRDRGPQEL